MSADAVEVKRRDRERVLPYRRIPPLLPKHDPAAPILHEGRFRSRKERANELRARMAAFSSIYNAAWRVREAYFGPEQRQRNAVLGMIAVLLGELPATLDHEALLFAIADALYCSPFGVPWEA